MGEISGLATCVLTGGRAENKSHLLMRRAGPLGDRKAVLFDPETGKRVSQKQHSKLAQIAARSISGGRLQFSHAEAGELVVASRDITSCTFVNEFGDLTPVFDAGDPNDYFSRFLGKTVHLGIKTLQWQHGGHIPPAQRANAPLHIITDETVAQYQDDVRGISFDGSSFRPNIRLSGYEGVVPETEWIGKAIAVNGIAIAAIHRPTKRCPVPGNNQLTGEKEGNVQKIYRDLPKAEDDGSPLFGVYAYPLLNPLEARMLEVGMPVEVVDWPH